MLLYNMYHVYLDIYILKILLCIFIASLLHFINTIKIQDKLFIMIIRLF